MDGMKIKCKHKQPLQVCDKRSGEQADTENTLLRSRIYCLSYKISLHNSIDHNHYCYYSMLAGRWKEGTTEKSYRHHHHHRLRLAGVYNKIIIVRRGINHPTRVKVSVFFFLFLRVRCKTEFDAFNGNCCLHWCSCVWGIKCNA